MNSFKEKSKKHYNETAVDYNNSFDGKFVEPMYQSLIEKIKTMPAKNLLDVGCGNGNVLCALADTELYLYGADLSEEMIKEAGKKLGERAKLAVSDAEKMPYDDGFFDLLICNASFHHYPHPEKVLCEMHRVLKKGAVLLIGEWLFKQPLRFIMNCFIRFSDGGDFHCYGKKELLEMLSNCGFEVSEINDTGKSTVLYCAKAV